MALSVAELKERYAGTVFDEVEVKVRQENILGFARACGEADPRYADPEHPEFQAPVNYVTCYHGARMFPDDFPDFDRRRMIDAGKAVEYHAPVRAGDVLTARSQLHDIYEKTGRSGTMLFLVHRMEFTNPQGVLTSVVDWRLILRGGVG